MAVEDLLREGKGALKSGIDEVGEGGRGGRRGKREKQEEEEGKVEGGGEKKDRKERSGERRERVKLVPTAKRVCVSPPPSHCVKQDTVFRLR